MGDLVDTIFGGGQGAGYADLEKMIREGMRQRQTYERGAEDVYSPFYRPGSYPEIDQGQKPPAQYAFGDWRKQGQPEGTSPSGQPFVLGLPEYTSELSQMRNAPEYYRNLAKGYEQSPEAKFQTEQGLKAVRATGAAQGLGGSGPEMQELEKLAQGVASQDFKDYMRNMLGIKQSYLGGEQDLVNKAYDAIRGIAQQRMNLGQQIGENYGNIGQARYGSDVASADAINKLIGTAAGAAMGFGGVLPGMPSGITSTLGKTLYGAGVGMGLGGR